MCLWVGFYSEMQLRTKNTSVPRSTRPKLGIRNKVPRNVKRPPHTDHNTRWLVYTNMGDYPIAWLVYTNMGRTAWLVYTNMSDKPLCRIRVNSSKGFLTSFSFFFFFRFATISENCVSAHRTFVWFIPSFYSVRNLTITLNYEPYCPFF